MTRESESASSVLVCLMCIFWICQIVCVPAIGEAKAIDATGAGDLFASGFLYGVIKGLSLEECCKVGTCSGGSVIRSLGGEVTLENWQWMYKHMQIKGLLTPDTSKWKSPIHRNLLPHFDFFLYNSSLAMRSNASSCCSPMLDLFHQCMKVGSLIF